jgi:WD40 repeat protein
MIGCGSLDGAVRVWDLRKKEVTASFKHHTDSVSCVTWNYTDQQIVSSSISGEIMVHSLLTKVSVGNLKLKGSAGIKVVQFSPFKKNFLGAGSENGSVYIWDINLRSVACSFPSFHNSPVTGLAFSAINHMLMCTSGLDQRINFYDTHEKKIVKTIDVESPLTCISYANDGHTLAGGTLYGTILIYDLRSPGTPKNVLKGHEGNAINWLDFSKSRDIKSRIQRDTSKDTRDNTRDARENKDLKENTKNTFFIPEDVVVGFSRFRPAEEVSVGASRFRTVEEIKQEAKMRVEQKRRERANEESKIDVKPDLSNIVRTSAQDRSPILNREEKVNLSTLDVRTEKPIPSLRPASREKTYEKLDEVKLEKQEKIPEKIERKERKEEFEDTYPQNDDQSRNQEPYNDRKYQPEENLDLRSNRELMEMFESRLNIQDEVIFDLKEDVQNLHVEMIRQFMIQIVRFNQ